jgi:hypothetical protein
LTTTSLPFGSRSWNCGWKWPSTTRKSFMPSASVSAGRIAAIMDGYSVALGCSETMLRVVERTAEQCADLLALAKKTCRAKIADGLPDKLDERDAYRLASRSKACIIRTIRGEAYRNEPADRESETLWKRDHGEQ